MYNRLLKLFMPLTAITILLLSCSKSSDNQRTTNPPPTDTTTTVTPPVNTKKWIVSTVAGSGAQGKADGDSINASFWYPTFITIDPLGNLFVSDQQNFNIRKITPGGQVSTYAGRDVSTPTPEYGNIYGLALDKQGNLFDVEYSLIRKITPALDNSVFAGGLLVSYKDTVGAYAAFNVIYSMAIDKDDTLYLPDYDMSGYPHIRKVAPDGMVSTLNLQDNTGYQDIDGPNHYYLFSITVDRDRNIYKTSNGSNLIKKITPDGNVTVFAGAGEARFSAITGMVTDSIGNLYVVDIGNGAIRKVTKDGTVSTIAGTGEQGFADGEGSQAKFNYPSGITISKEGVIYVTDAGNNRIRKIEYK